MSFRPLHDRVLVSRLEAKETTKGGIIIPGTAQEKPIEGKVVAVGSGLRTPEGKIIPLDVQVGDTVVFNKWSGTELTVDGVEYLVMKESDITGILDSNTAQKAA